MLGLMQSRPLLISGLVDYASTWHGRREIVSETRKEPSIARLTPKSRRAPSVSRTPLTRSAQAGAIGSRPSPGTAIVISKATMA